MYRADIVEVWEASQHSSDVEVASIQSSSVCSVFFPVTPAASLWPANFGLSAIVEYLER